jgi:hypothetical protein
VLYQAEPRPDLLSIYPKDRAGARENRDNLVASAHTLRQVRKPGRRRSPDSTVSGQLSAKSLTWLFFAFALADG